MTARYVAAATVVAMVLAVSLPRARQGPPQEPAQLPTFRSTASGVTVDVAVRDRTRRPVTNLKSSDFEVLDNGVAQTVESLSYGRLPIDVTVALDTSYSVTGVVLDRLRRGVIQLMGDLGREDRLRLLVFNMRVSRVVDFTSDERDVERAMKTVTAGGSTALLDAISVALVSGSAPDRRQLVVFFTDGGDSNSVTTPSMIATVARRARATLTFVMPAVGSSSVIRLAPGTTSTSAMATASVNFLSLARTDTVYSQLARETGGSVLPVTATTDLSATFRRVLDEFRSAYVLYFNARGVEPGGYHTLDVKVKRENLTVQARRGYWY